MGLTPSTAVIASNPSGRNTESPIVGQIRPIKIGHTWSLSNIRGLCARMKPGECIVSPIFFAGLKRDYQWRLILYPSGCNEDNAKHVSLYLQLVSSVPNSDTVPQLAVRASVSLSIINKSGDEVNLMKPRMQFHFVKDRTLWGFGKFISHEKLLALSADNQYLSGNPKNPRLTIFCDHNDCESTRDMPAECNLTKIFAMESVQKISSDFEVLLCNSNFSDVTIETATRQFFAHKVILSARSPVFAAMFIHEMREKTENKLFVEDVSDEIMAELLRYIYTGKVVDLHGNVMELLVASDKYTLNELKNICEDVLINSLTNDNAFELLTFADMYDARILKSKITEFVIEHSKDVVLSRNFEVAMNSHPKLIAEIFQKMAVQK